MTDAVQSVESIDRAAKVDSECPECGARSVFPCLVQTEQGWATSWWCDDCTAEVRIER